MKEADLRVVSCECADSGLKRLLSCCICDGDLAGRPRGWAQGELRGIGFAPSGCIPG